MVSSWDLATNDTVKTRVTHEQKRDLIEASYRGAPPEAYLFLRFTSERAKGSGQGCDKVTD